MKHRTIRGRDGIAGEQFELEPEEKIFQVPMVLPDEVPA